MAVRDVTGFLNKTMTVRGETRRYVVYVPHEYTPAKAWPLIVFLHGRGERGDDGLKQTDIGIGRALRRTPELLPAIVVMPQCPKTVYWDEALEDIEVAYQQTVAEYATDPSRHYLTGLSMGGFAAWLVGVEHPDRFAGMLVICGGGEPETVNVLKNVPTWVFHGDEDTTVPPERSREMVDALKRAKGKVWYTEYKGVGHFSWEPVFDDPKVLKWLLKQRK